MKVAAVVVNWNGGDDTMRCLASLRASRVPVDVVVVDNGSTDGSLERIRAEFPSARVLEMLENKGFCDGTNAGAEEAMRRGADSVLVLNNDAWVDPEFLPPLLDELARDASVGAVGPKILFAHDTSRIWSVGGRVRFGANVSELFGSGTRDEKGPSAPFECDYLPGCALLARGEVYRKLKGFDPEYFAYMEDVDFGMRMREAGWRVRAVPASRVFHRPSSSSGGGYSRARKYANAVNSVRFLRRHGSPTRWAAFLLFDVAGLALAWLRESVRRGGDTGAVAAKARGLRDGLRGARVTAATFARPHAQANG